MKNNTNTEVLNEAFEEMYISLLSEEINHFLGTEEYKGPVIASKNKYDEVAFEKMLATLHPSYQSIGMEFKIISTRREFLKLSLFTYKHLQPARLFFLILGGRSPVVSNTNNRTYIFPFALKNRNDAEERYMLLYSALITSLREQLRLSDGNGSWWDKKNKHQIQKDITLFLIRMIVRNHKTLRAIIKEYEEYQLH